MLRKLFFGLLLIILLGALAACKSSEPLSEKEESFLALVPVDSMNDKLQLTHLDFVGDGKTWLVIELMMENISDEEIVFPYDKGARLFTYNESESTWLEIDDSFNLLSRDDIILTTKENPLSNIAIVTVAPDLLNNDKPFTVRIVVVGTVLRDGEPADETVGAFVDVTLQP